MLNKYNVQKKKKKRDLIVLILHFHFLVFSLLAVLWGIWKLKQKSVQNSSQQILERKARFLPAWDKEIAKPP